MKALIGFSAAAALAGAACGAPSATRPQGERDGVRRAGAHLDPGAEHQGREEDAVLDLGDAHLGQLVAYGPISDIAASRPEQSGRGLEEVFLALTERA